MSQGANKTSGPHLFSELLFLLLEIPTRLSHGYLASACPELLVYLQSPQGRKAPPCPGPGQEVGDYPSTTRATPTSLKLWSPLLHPPGPCPGLGASSRVWTTAVSL